MSGVVVQTAAGELALRRPTAAEVIELEEARRYMAAPAKGAVVGRDDGTETILRCITNQTPDAARAILRKYPGLVRLRLVAAFREAGGDDAAGAVERDESVVTLDQRKTYGPEVIGLRCFRVAVVLRPMQPERYQLMERLIAQDPLRYGVPFGELARIGKEHIVSPVGAELDQLLDEHPYLSINLAQLLLEVASGVDADVLGKLPRSSMGSTKSGGAPQSEMPGSTSPPSTGSAGSESAAPPPSPAP